MYGNHSPYTRNEVPKSILLELYIFCNCWLPMRVKKGEHNGIGLRQRVAESKNFSQ